MKRLLSCVMLCGLVVQWGSAQGNSKDSTGNSQFHRPKARALASFNYDFTTSVDPYADLVGATSINNGEIWDQPTYTVFMDFPFELNGHAVTSFHFNGSGSSLASYIQVPFVVAEIFPFESDLIDRGALGSASLSPISYSTEGQPGSRIQKIEFNNAGSYFEMDELGTLDMYVNFQCWLYEGSNNIEFHFGPSSIPNPLVFYGGGNGPECGLTDYDEFDNLFTNGHFLMGSASNPFLSEDLSFINGTPASGTVYRFTYIAPVTLMVTGEEGTSFCQPNGSAQVEATGGILPYAYLWSTGATTSSIDSLDAGTYHVTVTDANGSSVTDSVTIVNAPPMIVNVTSSNETAPGANDGTAQAFPTGGSPPYMFAWSNGDTSSLNTGLAPGSYEVTVTDSSECEIVQSIYINAFTCPDLALEASILNATCFGQCNGSISVLPIGLGTPPYTFHWNEGSSTPAIAELCWGDYSVMVVDANGCTVDGNYQVGQPAELLLSIGSTNESSSEQNDGTVWAAPSGGTPPYAYTWNNGSTDSLIINLTPGEYVVTLSDAFGCDTRDSIVVHPFCTGYMEGSIQNYSCLDTCQWGVSYFIVDGGSGPYSYLWSTGDTTINSLDGLCPGPYGLTIVDMSTQCMYVTAFSIIQPEPIIAVVDTIMNLTDSSAAAISISVISGTPPYFFSWYGPNGYAGNEEDLTGIEPGFYTVQVYNTSGHCGEIDSIEVLDMTVDVSILPVWGLDIYPNPAHDKIFVQGIDVKEFQIQLLSSDGVSLRQWRNTSILDIQDLAPGMYYLQLTSDRNSVTRPILIMR